MRYGGRVLVVGLLASATVAVVPSVLHAGDTPAPDPTVPDEHGQRRRDAAAAGVADAREWDRDVSTLTTSSLIVLPAPEVDDEALVSRAAAFSDGDVEVADPLGGGYEVLELGEAVTLEDAEAIAAALVAEGIVVEAQPNSPRWIAAPPNDTRYGEQWNLSNTYSGTPAYGINVEPAWDITTGSPSIVVAVLDTGSLPHPDIDDRFVPGYDMISIPGIARDGDGRDPNPMDQGDWNAAGQCGPGDPARNSSWHGLHVSGTIGAETDNAEGVAGVDRQARLQPVRVLGLCGGTVADTVDGIRWAAGLPVPGVPNNATPARVINVSLGGPGSCGAAEQAAIDAAVAAGAVVVVAAGNQAVDLDNVQTSPANCNGVITVAATTRIGDRAVYSNFGSTVEIAAPGGDRITSAGDDEKILSTYNTSPMAPDLTGGGWTEAFLQGTSMATPHVSGVVSLMLAVRPSLTAAQVLYLIKSTATSFPPSPFGPSFTCSANPEATIHCGAGIMNAGAAVQAATSLAVPSAPRSPTASPTNHAATVSWQAPSSNGGAPITRYTVTASPGGQTCTWTSGPLTCTVTGLTNGAAYTFTVRATTVAGTGPPSTLTAPVVPQADFTPLAPSRVFDTRSGDGGVPAGRVEPEVPLRVRMTGRNGVPLSGVGAVSLNVTVTNPLAAGFVTVFPCLFGLPVASNLNYVEGQDVPNAVIVPVDPNGEVCFYTFAATDLIADVNGWFAAGEDFTPLAPSRVFDTRSGDGGVPVGRVGPEVPLRVKLTGRNGVPLSGVGAVSLNVTVTNPLAAGFVTVFPCLFGLPVASNLNYVEGQDVPNAVIVPVDPNGEVCFYTFAATDLIADVNGWFAA